MRRHRPAGVHNVDMGPGLVVVIAFLLFAVLLAVGILVMVALPNLSRRRDEEGHEPVDRRHSSRTGR